MTQYKIVEISANNIEIQTIDGQIIGSINPYHINSKSNAEFVGRAMNSFDDMVAAIEYYFDVIDEVRGADWREKPDHVMQKMLAALSKARGEQS